MKGITGRLKVFKRDELQGDKEFIKGVNNMEI